MIDYVILIVAIPLMAFIGLGALGTAVLIIYRDLLGIDDKASWWLDRQFGTGFGISKRWTESGSNVLLKRLALLGLAVGSGFFGYLCLRYGVAELIAEHVFGYVIE